MNKVLTSKTNQKGQKKDANNSRWAILEPKLCLNTTKEINESYIKLWVVSSLREKSYAISIDLKGKQASNTQ